MKLIQWPFNGLLVIMVTLLITIGYQPSEVRGQELRSSVQTKQLLNRLDYNTERFSKTVDTSLDRSRLNDTALEDQVNALVNEFESATDRLSERANDNLVIHGDVNEVLRRGMRIDMFMQTHNLSAMAHRDWRVVKKDLERLAQMYGVAWSWVPSTNPELNRSSTRQVIRRLEHNADEFRSSFDSALDRSALDGSSYEDFMNNMVAVFENSVDRLKDQANRSGTIHSEDIKITLQNAAAIDDFLKKQSLTARTRSDWARVKTNLDDLAFLNQVVWDWTKRPDMPAVSRIEGEPQGQRVALIGTVTRPVGAIVREVRHSLLSEVPYYGVFDWIEFEVMPDNAVILRGEVTTPPDTKSRAEAVVRDVDGVTRVVNEIRVLPVSPNDDRLRRALYSEIYGFNSPLFRYGIGSRQAIHIIVEDGRATLKGMVDTQADKNIAYVRARGVPGLFEVTNQLAVRDEMPR